MNETKTVEKLKYLEKYMAPKEKRKKKKVKPPSTGHSGEFRLRILDDDVDLKQLPSAKQNDESGDDDVPVVASVIDDRPLHVKVAEQYQSSQWKTIEPKPEGNKDLARASSRSSAQKKTKTCDSRGSTAKGHDPDSDISPDRHYAADDRPSPSRRHDTDSDQSPTRKGHSDSDLSPPRGKSLGGDITPVGKRSSDSDLSPLRERGSGGGPSSPRSRKKLHKARKKTKEVKVKKEKEEKKVMEVIKLRDTSKADKAKAAAAQEEERKKVYDKWGKGLAQQEQQDKNLEEHLHEMSKPFSRYEDDADLEKHLKEKERAGDPMLKFIKKKKKGSVESKRPRYSGPEPPPNRFGIWPGYRWDGLNRSNGFEKRLVELKNSAKANEEEAYKWSVEDM